MPQVPSVVPLLLLLAVLVQATCGLHLSPSASDTGRRQRQSHHWPRHAIADPDDRNYEIDSSRLRHATQQLLELNDGELQALMSGMPPQAVAHSLEPSTAFLLASSRRYLESLDTILSTAGDDSPIRKSTWNPKIARRHKKERSNRKNKSVEPRQQPDDADHRISSSSAGRRGEDPDSILSALSELSAYLSDTQGNSQEEEEEEEQEVQEQEEEVSQLERKRRSHRRQGHGRNHQTLQASQYETRHYLYYLRSGECPISSDGINRKRYCPSPSATGDWACIEDEELCDGISQCPNQEDEAPTHCLFHKAMRTHIDMLTKFILEEFKRS